MKKITIVGGGTAGWMAAAFLSKFHPEHKITIIDKVVSTPVGVGEATVLDFEPFMKECGFDFAELLTAVDGSFKGGILFPGWGKEDNTVWHPFFIHVKYKDLRYTSQWDVWAQDQSQPFSTHGIPMLKVCEEHKIDLNNSAYYGYHVDCGKLVNFIESKIHPFIDIIRSGVVEVVKTGSTVSKLILENGTEHHADLFIDCTGWTNLLKTPKKVNLEDRLFCNTAVAGHVPYVDESTEFRPYVISEAVDHGWIWKIPVQGRFGSGLVFNRNITDVEEAKEFFVKHWDNRVSKDKLKVIDWTPYYVENCWEGNVVSVGLSSGFIEPLESTGLAFMRAGIRRISDKISLGRWDEYDIALYNAQMKRTYEDTVDFINMHYANSQRKSPFWDYVREKHVTSKSQLFYEEYMKDPEEAFKYIPELSRDSTMFHHVNWILWMIQLGYPVNKNIDLPKEIVEDIMKGFIHNENLRCETSIDHCRIIDTLNARRDFLSGNSPDDASVEILKALDNK
jgi:tryptophan halogenase